MKEFKYCHEEITEGVELPAFVCETQKEMVKSIADTLNGWKEIYWHIENRIKPDFKKSVQFDREWYPNDDWRFENLEKRLNKIIDDFIYPEDETSIYIIYKDGSTYHAMIDETNGKFKRYGIKAAVIETAYDVTVFGDFAITDDGRISVDEDDIEEYGIYAGQYDVKEQDEQEVQEAVEQTTEVETKTEEMAETEEYDSGFEYYSVKVAYEAMRDKTYSIVFMNYLEALKVAKHVTKVLGGEKAIVIAVNFVIRNDRQPESERDKMVLEAETAEIESRCVPYNYLGLRGYVSIEDKQIVNEDIA